MMREKGNEILKKRTGGDGGYRAELGIPAVF